MKRTFLLLATPLIALSLTACKGEFAPAPPPTEDDEESLVGAQSGYDEDETSEEESLDQKYGAREPLPEMAEPKEKCTGKKDKRVCEMVDPKPKVSAAYGTRKLLEGFRWGMDVETVMAQLSKEIEAEYQKRQGDAANAVAQDENLRWRDGELAQLAQRHIVLEERAHHKWGVSAISGEFVNDQDEELIWVKGATLKKFYFFKDGELWRIVYTYSNQHWPGLDYEEILKTKFMKWFGPSPTEEVQIDEKTQAPVMRYKQWESMDGDMVRAFDMKAVHGVVMLSVVDKNAEERYGLRLPNPPKGEAMHEEVDDVLGGSDICYDSEGNMVSDAEKCKEIRGY